MQTDLFNSVNLFQSKTYAPKSLNWKRVKAMMYKRSLSAMIFLSFVYLDCTNNFFVKKMIGVCSLHDNPVFI